METGGRPGRRDQGHGGAWQELRARQTGHVGAGGARGGAVKAPPPAEAGPGGRGQAVPPQSLPPSLSPSVRPQGVEILSSQLTLCGSALNAL